MTILQALKGYYDRVAEREPAAIAAPGYSDEKISFVLVIDADGKVVADEDWRDTDGRKPQPRLMPVPASFKRPGKTPKSFFLWDKTAFALGVTEGGENEPFAPSLRQHEAFRRIHLDNLANEQDKGLAALRRFVETWSPDNFSKLTHAADMLDTNVVFRLNGEAGFIHDRSAAKDIWRKVRASIGADASQCLVTGEQEPVARLHPAIKNVPGQTMGGSIVSFNLNAFTSYDLEQGDNAPVSETAAFAYTTALNRLLRADSRNRIQLADATTVFWAEAENAVEAEAAEEIFGGFFDPPSDADETKKLRDIVQRIEKGEPLAHIDPKLDEATKFYILGLSPNAARLSVRFWHRTTLGDIGHRFHQHWRDLKIDGLRGTRPPAIWLLLTRMAPARRNEQGQVKYDTKHIPPNLAGEVMRAILTGAPYPRTLLANLIMRLRTDRVVDGLRVALIKACLVRAMRRDKPDLPKEAYVSLNPEDPDPAYRLGRLFALLEKAQSASIDGLNATICDKYYGAAAATPARVFGFLIKNSKNHLATLRKGRGAKWVKKPAATGGWLDREIGEVHAAFVGSFPASLTLEEQSRFAIGYYHQKYVKREDVPEDIKIDAPIEEIGNDNN